MTDQLFEFATTVLGQDLGVSFKVDINTKSGHVLRVAPRSLDEAANAGTTIRILIAEWEPGEGQTAFATYIGKLGTRVMVPVWIIEPTAAPDGTVVS